jgi:hypothetical protein
MEKVAQIAVVGMGLSDIMCRRGEGARKTELEAVNLLIQ